MAGISDVSGLLGHIRCIFTCKPLISALTFTLFIGIILLTLIGTALWAQDGRLNALDRKQAADQVHLEYIRENTDEIKHRLERIEDRLP